MSAGGSSGTDEVSHTHTTGFLTMKVRQQKDSESDAKYLRSARRYAHRRFLVHCDLEPHCHESHNVERALEDTEKRFVDLGTCGVEGGCRDNGEGHITIQYLNTGYAYSPTIVYWKGRFQIASCGDIAELI